MAPSSPVPLDPGLRIWSSHSAYTSSIDDILSPGGGPGPPFHDRLPQPGHIGNNVGQSDTLRLPSMTGTDPSSINQWNNDPNEPWSPLRHNLQMDHPGIGQGYPRFNTQGIPPEADYRHYRQPERSDGSVSTHDRPRDDSGYGSRSLLSPSVHSDDRLDQSQGCSSVAGDIDNMRIYQDPTAFTMEHDFSQPRDDQSTSVGSVSAHSPRPRVSGPLICNYDNCGHASKNPSEHK